MCQGIVIASCLEGGSYRAFVSCRLPKIVVWSSSISSLCLLVWCLETVTAWPWWTTSRKLCCSTWERRSSTARLTPTRGSLSPHAEDDSPLEVSCSSLVAPPSHFLALLSPLRDTAVQLLSVHQLPSLPLKSKPPSIHLLQPLVSLCGAKAVRIGWRGGADTWQPPWLCNTGTAPCSSCSRSTGGIAGRFSIC